MTATDRFAKARSMRAVPILRLQCPTGEHGPGVVLYIRAVDGWCRCGRKLRPMLPSERIARPARVDNIPADVAD